MTATKTPDDLAELLRKPRSWVMGRLHELPHLRVGRAVRFTDQHIAEILTAFERRPVGVLDQSGLSDLSRARLGRRSR